MDLNQPLATLLEVLHQALDVAPTGRGPDTATARAVQAALRRPLTRLPLAHGGAALPWPEEMAVALEHARAGGAQALLDPLVPILPALNWVCRPRSAADPEGFQRGHRNALLVGTAALASVPGLTLGLTLMRPGITYPVHRHPPHEVYFVLSAGQWYQRGRSWASPGIGGLVYNRPSIEHAMRAGPAPLLSLWALVAE